MKTPISKTLFIAALIPLVGFATFADAQENSRPRPPASTSRVAAEKIAFLGVVTGNLVPALRQHLEIEEGFGLQVVYVADDSPASEKGLKAHDILTKFDDQLLTTPDHLATLVRSREKGEKVTLTLIRKGDEQSIDVTLSEHEVPVVQNLPSHFQTAPNPRRQHEEQWQDAMRHYQETMNSHQRRPNPPQANVQTKTRKPPAISVRPGFPIQIFGTKGIVKIDNEHGEVTIQEKGDKHTITIQDADGKVIYDGDFDPEKGPKSLPKKAQEHLKKMKLDDLKVFAPGAPRPGPEPKKISAPVKKAKPDPSIL